MLIEKLQPRSFDERRDLIVPGDHQTTLIYCVEHFVKLAKDAIKDHGAFYVALSGGSTPEAIYSHLSASPYNQMIDWTKVHLFWSDERTAGPDDPESNYHMSMQAGLKKTPVPPEQIHRMQAEEHIEENALAYEKLIQQELKGRPFDLIMLGMGEDGHTASLFPHTKALKEETRLVVSNHVPQKNTWRMTFTYTLINQASHIAIYVMGQAKKQILAKVLLSPNQFDTYPIQKIGIPKNHALWICDELAAEGLIAQKEQKKMSS